MTEAGQGGDEPELEGRPEAARALLEAHGAALCRYGMAMVGEPRMLEVMSSVVGHIEEHLVDFRASVEGPEARLTLYAVVHNRCIELGRARVPAPRGEQLEGDEARVVDAIAGLHPVGRAVLVLRSVLGLRWSEMERVCGLPRDRLLNRVFVAWRRTKRKDGPTVMSSVGERPKGEPFAERPEAWESIRARMREFVALRSALRRVYAEPPPGWYGGIWEQLERSRAEARKAAAVAKEEDQDVEDQDVEGQDVEGPDQADDSRDLGSPTAPSSSVAGSANDRGPVEGEARVPPVGMRRSWSWIAAGIVLLGLFTWWLQSR
ncbi:MAG: hypothetical protein AAGF11_22225 [Myxococcota bacterium]